jgi:hypothetical protein
MVVASDLRNHQHADAVNGVRIQAHFETQILLDLVDWFIQFSYLFTHLYSDIFIFVDSQFICTNFHTNNVLHCHTNVITIADTDFYVIKL